ncbi:MAG: Amidase enhancer [Dehalococcoidia bacterium]|nr:Amidase enhancer [Bacillota bacterium]
MKRVVISLFLAVILVLPFFFPVKAEANVTACGPQIAVRLSNFLGNREAVTFAVVGEYVFSADNRPLAQNVRFTVRRENSELVLFRGSERLGSFGNSFTVRPLSYNTSSFITIESPTAVSPTASRDYLGEITFTIENGRFIRPINRLPLEDYLKGVVPREMPALWPIEALKAQAVAARTFALRRVNQIIGDTQQFQVYGGFPREPWTSRTSLAVEETRGQVLFFNNALAETLYSSSNGGFTESNSNAWGRAQLAYLPSQADSFDPQNGWAVNLHRQQIDLAGRDLANPALWWSSVNERDLVIANNLKLWLGQNGFAGLELKIVAIPDLQVAEERNSSGRRVRASITLEFISRRVDGTFVMNENGSVRITRSEHNNIPITILRAMLGTMQMRSLLVDSFVANGAGYSLAGRGFGHGVGMSQHGARVMADRGYSFIEILNFYYPGTALINQPWAAPAPSLPEEQPVPIPTTSFSDIQGHWAKSEIIAMTELGVAGGVTKDSFGPNSLVTRAQFAAFLIRSLRLAEANPAAGRFSDVSPTAWYYGAVEAAHAAQLVGGYPDGSFRPDQPITRSEIAVMVVRALAPLVAAPVSSTSPESVLASRFTDWNIIAAWAREAVAQAVEANIVKGRDRNLFAPEENASRAEAVVMLKRMLSSTGRLSQ